MSARITEIVAPRSPGRGHETLPYVEDDENVRSLMSMVLRGDGYTVIVAADGVEALRLAAPHRDALALAITGLAWMAVAAAKPPETRTR